MKLGKLAYEKIEFALFCLEHNIKPYDLAVLTTIAHRAFSAGVVACNTGDHSREYQLAVQFEERAARFCY